MKSGEPFALAALWENWRDPAIGDNIRFTVLTCEPNPLMATFHNRVPVILASEDYMTWLTDPEPEHLMKAFPAELMTVWKIGLDVGNPRNRRPVQARREPRCCPDRIAACTAPSGEEA